MHAFERLKNFLGDFYTPLYLTFKVLLIIGVSILIVTLGSIVIRKIFEKQKFFKYTQDIRKLDTLSTLMVSVFRYGVYIFAVIITLTDVFNFSSVLAAAGVGGIAIGLGAQSLIRDVISGFFIVMEDQYVVGDLITIENMNGFVEKLELRVTKIRNFNGDLHIIPNGEVKRVTNHSRGYKAVLVDIPVSYHSDIGKVFSIAEKICRQVNEDYRKVITEDARVLGITELGKDSLNLRIFAKTLVNEQWEVERKIRRMVNEEFNRENIDFYNKYKIMSENASEKDEK